MAAKTKDTGTWDVVTGCNYPPDDQRAEPGDVIGEGDLPKPLPQSVDALLTIGCITPRDDTAKKLADAWADKQKG